MKDYALELAARETGVNAKRNILREYLQAYALRVMQDFGMFRTTAFLGGTALRFLHDLPRFSEDLGFSLTHPQQTGYEFVELLTKLKQEFILAGYTVDVTFHDDKVVWSAFIKFEGLLFDAGISPHADQKFSIKVEIDTRPPEGAGFRTDLINRHFPVAFLAYDLPSLLAGKLHAVMSRKYTKGRDFFDLGWYLARFKGLTPNFLFLRNALEQSRWSGPIPTTDTWRAMLRDIIIQTDWMKVHSDVENFLERPSDSEIMSQKNIVGLLE